MSTGCTRARPVSVFNGAAAAAVAPTYNCAMANQSKGLLEDIHFDKLKEEDLSWESILACLCCRSFDFSVLVRDLEAFGIARSGYGE